MKRIVWVAAAFAALICATSATATEVVDVVIYTTRGEVPLKLELASTPETRVQGLMNRDGLAPADGMLFLFPSAYDYSFWMKDTRIPLDMLFINEKRAIVHIEADVPPYTRAERSSGQEITAVIELDGGRASSESIAEGDRVRYDLPKDIEVK